MKKIKLFALAVFAMLSTNVFAEVGDESATTVFRYTITAEPDGEGDAATPGTAEILGFVAGYVAPATVEIPATVLFTDGETEYNVKSIAASAFANKAVAFDFTKATNLETIGLGAFAGTKIVTLDLSKTKVKAIGNIFGTAIGEGDENIVYASLTTVKLPNAWTSINNGAFVNCTALSAVNFGTAPEPAEGEDPIVQTIAAGAFTNTALVKLDLSKTKVAQINNLFGTVIDVTPANNVTYPSLTTVKLPNAWTSIAQSAFANCTALTAINFGTAPEPAEGENPIVQTIGGLALAGTAVKALDFSKTFVAGVPDNLLYIAGVGKNTTLKTVTINKVWQFDIWENNGTEAEPDWIQVQAGTAFANCEALTTFNGLDATNPGAAEGDDPMAIYQNLPAAGFKGDKALTTIKTSTILNFNPNVFEDCAALKTIDLSSATWIGNEAFKNSGLTAVEIPGTVGYINASAFENCAALATVTFGHNTVAPEAEGDPDLDPFFGIGARAFYGTAFTTITIPSTLQPMMIEQEGQDPVVDEIQDGKIATRAFADSKVKDFTLKPTAPIAGQVDANAFVGCDAVTFHTITDYVLQNANAPKKCTYAIEDPDAPVIEPDELPATESKKASQAGKYYVKYKNVEGAAIKVKTTDAKVYAAYLDADTKELNMQMFKSKGGYYHIAAGDIVLMLTTLEAVPYEGDAEAAGTSWVAVAGTEGDNYGFDNVNQFKYVSDEDGELRSEIEADAPAETPYIYGWINNATYGYGFQKITSGKTFPQGTLYVLAGEPADGANARVIWRDEFGNIEAETTAIQGIVEAKAENGMIYNVAGQKVNASYKGLVIKDGKKYMK